MKNIPNKKEYCERRAKEESYEEIEMRTSGFCTGYWQEIPWHYKANPKDFEEEYDMKFNPNKIREKIIKNIEEYYSQKNTIHSDKVRFPIDKYPPIEGLPSPNAGES